LRGCKRLDLVRLGGQSGGQSFSELILFETKAALENFKNRELEVRSKCIRSGHEERRCRHREVTDEVLVFVEPKANLMLPAALGGQSFSFQPI